MFRKLLACLAPLTGLAAAGTPAQAGVAVTMASRIEASASGTAVARGPVATAAARRVAGRRMAARKAAWPVLDLPSPNPTVLLGSDRARE